jgi:hypothetical protein
MSDTNFPDYSLIKAMALALNRPARSLLALTWPMRRVLRETRKALRR